ncbi:MAG: hypothetical protein WBP58_04695 [Chitinophagaceae bacterium]
MKHTLHICFTFTFLLFLSVKSFSQDNAEKIKGKWIFEKVELIKPGADPAAIHQALLNTIFEFDSKEVQLSRKESDKETPIKKSPYQILGSTLTIGTDPAEILELTDKKLVIKTPQAIIHYLRM